MASYRFDLVPHPGFLRVAARELSQNGVGAQNDGWREDA
jgi:hypothetical protein